MKPTSYRTQPAYGQMIQKQQAAESNSAQAVKGMGVDMVEAAFYQQGLQRSLELGYMGLQKEMFTTNLEENKRQFDIGMDESKRQFGSKMNFARDQFKYQRRQDNRAELVAMANIGMSIGFGYLQYKQQRRTLNEYNKRMKVYELKGVV